MTMKEWIKIKHKQDQTTGLCKHCGCTEVLRVLIRHGCPVCGSTKEIAVFAIKLGCKKVIL